MNALILVDIQNDFLPGGALPVPGGDQVVPVANAMIDRAKAVGVSGGDLVVATQDLHPADHGSFASQHPGKRPGDVIELAGLQQVLWPDHCVRGTPGAAFAPGLDTDAFDAVFPKGTDRTIDSYSGFFDNDHRRATGLGDYLAERGVADVAILGLATDYCVKATALDAIGLGLGVTLIRAGVRGVDLQPGDSERAIEEMRQAGAVIDVTIGARSEE